MGNREAFSQSSSYCNNQYNCVYVLILTEFVQSGRRFTHSIKILTLVGEKLCSVVCHILDVWNALPFRSFWPQYSIVLWRSVLMILFTCVILQYSVLFSARDVNCFIHFSVLCVPILTAKIWVSCFMRLPFLDLRSVTISLFTDLRRFCSLSFLDLSGKVFILLLISFGLFTLWRIYVCYTHYGHTQLQLTETKEPKQP